MKGWIISIVVVLILSIFWGVNLLWKNNEVNPSESQIQGHNVKSSPQFSSILTSSDESIISDASCQRLVEQTEDPAFLKNSREKSLVEYFNQLYSQNWT